jgi:GT2 family glycosyltransferase
MPGNKWLKVLKYQDKLSHWQAKNMAVKESSGEFLFFADAHVVPGRNSIRDMFSFYEDMHHVLNGSIHLPLTYQILEWRKLIYTLVADPEKGAFHYRFCSYRHADEPYEVPCMSTCGMLITKELFNKLGGWPTELGIYGGGENFINFSLATMGYKKWIMPGEPLYHYGEKRGYHWNYTDHLRNRAIAVYVSSGGKMLRRFLSNSKGHQTVKKKIENDIMIKCGDHRNLIKSQSTVDLGDWSKKWA